MKMIPGCCAVPLPLSARLGYRPFVQYHLRDGMRLPTARRAICKDGGIVPIQDAIKKPSCRRLIHVPLRSILVKDSIKAKSLVFNSFPGVWDN